MIQFFHPSSEISLRKPFSHHKTYQTEIPCISRENFYIAVVTGDNTFFEKRAKQTYLQSLRYFVPSNVFIIGTTEASSADNFCKQNGCVFIGHQSPNSHAGAQSRFMDAFVIMATKAIERNDSKVRWFILLDDDGML